MSSATTNRSSAAMTSAVSSPRSIFSSMQPPDFVQQARSTRFPEFGAAPGRHPSDDRSSQSSTLAQTFGNTGTWQPSSGIWGNSTIGSGLSNVKRDASRSRGRSMGGVEAFAVTDVKTAAGSDGFPDGPSGSGALAASSEADPWVSRTNGPWNPPDTTSPTIQSSHSGSTSPSHTRNSLPSATPQTLLELNQYQQSRPAISHTATFSRSQPKSSLDPSSGSFKYVHKPSFIYDDNKENSREYISSADSYDIDIPQRFIPIGNSASRDGSMPPSRASDSGLNGLAFANGNAPFGSIGHTPNSSIHSQRPSFSGPSGSYPSQGNGSKYELPPNEAELSEKLAGFGFRESEQCTTSQLNNGLGSSYSPNHPNFPQQTYPLGSTSGMWGDGPKAPNNYEPYSNQHFADQGYYNKNRFGAERSSVSPAGSDYRRGLSSPKFYSASGTPPSGSDQIYRPSSRGLRIPQGPSELDRRLQNIHIAQQTYMYGGHFQGQYPPHVYDFPPQNFRQAQYGYQIPMPAYPPTQVIPTRPAKDQDVGVGVRSVLLEEFRSNSKSNKRYELKVGYAEPVHVY